jgi:hypothetical protein
MHPLRAFLVSLTAGLALLFGGHGLASSMTPAADARIGTGPLQVPTA